MSLHLNFNLLSIASYYSSLTIEYNQEKKSMAPKQGALWKQ